MLYIYMEGHDSKYDLFHLSKVFFPHHEIVFIENLEKYKAQGYLLKSSLYKDEDILYAKASIYLNGYFHDERVERIDNIDIGRNSSKAITKIGIKKSIYNVFLSIADKKAPWGILMGIRPVKIVHNLLDKEIDEDRILNILVKEYKLDLRKANLIMDISKRQRKYIYPLDGNRFSLYISIPFCPSRCIYCSFPSVPISRYADMIGEYRDRLIWEIDKIGELMSEKQINTVYIGGGTPTAIPAGDLNRIIQRVYLNFGKDNIREFTVEAGRPDTVTREMLNMLKENDIDRISINPQTMNDKTLRIIGRCHDRKDTERAYHLAKEIGFQIINMDLIVGLPYEGREEIIKTLVDIEKLDPENLTVHTLAIKRGSKFERTVNRYSIGDQYTIERMLKETVNYAYRMDLKPYYLYRQKQIMGNFENIGYSKEGMECIYNIAIMEERETIIGAGMGAVSKILLSGKNRLKRVPNFKSMEEYMKRTDELVGRKREVLLLSTL